MDKECRYRQGNSIMFRNIYHTGGLREPCAERVAGAHGAGQ
jgi:hypothetical protein